MCACTRRHALALLGSTAAALIGGPSLAVPDERTKKFISAAFAMKAEAERAGDQPYGAVLVRGGEIVGWGPSRVVTKRDWTAHAEREAIRDAQRRLGTTRLEAAELYSTSRPCGECERAAAEANVARMYFGIDAADAGPPRKS